MFTFVSVRWKGIIPIMTFFTPDSAIHIYKYNVKRSLHPVHNRPNGYTGHIKLRLIYCHRVTMKYHSAFKNKKIFQSCIWSLFYMHLFTHSFYLCICTYIQYYAHTEHTKRLSRGQEAVMKDMVDFIVRIQKNWQHNPNKTEQSIYAQQLYRKIYNIRRTLVGNKFVDHSDIVTASSVGAAPTASSLST